MTHRQPTEWQQGERVCVPRRHNGPKLSRRRLSAAHAALRTAGRSAAVQVHEAAMLVSAVAMTPLRMLAGGFDGRGTAPPSVRSLTAPTTRPVLLVHGFAGTASSWSVIAETLRARGVVVETMSYSPVGTSVEQLAEQLVVEVEKILRANGTDKVHLVGHSLGGVVIARAVADCRLNGRVHTVITLGSPFGGSPWAGVLPFVEIVRALRAGSPVLRQLASTPLPRGVRWLSVTAALDIIVPGQRSVPSHADVETVTVDGIGHLGMLLSQQVIGCITNALCAPKAPTAAHPAMHLVSSAS